MKREIKFRAWHHAEKKMCEVSTINFESGAFLIGVKKGEDQLLDGGKTYVVAPDNGRFCDWDEFDLLEYTGLKDKNGVEIYEGHIIRCDVGNPYKDEYVQYEVPSLSEHGTYDYEMAWWQLGEVIGNIHENVEILK